MKKSKFIKEVKGVEKTGEIPNLVIQACKTLGEGVTAIELTTYLSKHTNGKIFEGIWWVIDKRTNLSIFGPLSEELYKILLQMTAERLIEFTPSHLLVWIVDGNPLPPNCSLARAGHRYYKTPHFYPYVLNLHK